MKRSTAVVVGAGVLVLVVLSGLVRRRPRPEERASDRRALLRELVRERAVPTRCGYDLMSRAGALAFDDRLDAAARGHAEWLVAHDALSHTGAGGSSGRDRVRTAGFRGEYRGELLADTIPDAVDVIRAWRTSFPHCVTMHDRAASLAGIAVARRPGTRRRDVWVVVLGSDAVR